MQQGSQPYESVTTTTYQTTQQPFPQQNGFSNSYQSSNFGAQPSFPTVVSSTSYAPVYTGNNMMVPAQGGQDIPLSSTGVNELELNKRLLDNRHETELKYADMEADRQKKWEDKAEKQRDKAAKWKAKGWAHMVSRHEQKAQKYEIKAHVHQMAAEDYKSKAKVIEDQRRMFDPPSEKKAPLPGAAADKKVDTTKSNAAANDANARKDAPKTDLTKGDEKKTDTRPSNTVNSTTQGTPSGTGQKADAIDTAPANRQEVPSGPQQ